MAVGFGVKTIRCESGERLPLLLDKATGIPLWEPTLFILTELRAAGRAENTLAQATRAVMVAHQVFRYLGVHVNERRWHGRLLTMSEVDVLTKLAGLQQEELDALFEQEEQVRKVVVAPRIGSLEKARMRMSGTSPKQVKPETKAIRLIYIRDYIRWLVTGWLMKLDAGHPHYQALSETAQAVVGRLNARIPLFDHSGGTRQGVSTEVRARLLEVIDPDSPENPWKNQHVRLRNQLIFLWLLLLGIRNGELLGLYASDVNLRAGEVVVVRRPDNPEEQRKNAPLVKTRGRLLALSPQLAELTKSYVMGFRAAIKGARRHPYLFVATGTGTPLSKSALNKLFRELREKVPGLPVELSPHILRHTWNDDFSELMDRRGVLPEDEEKMRRQAMGWSPQSKMAAHYTKRHVQRKTNAASLGMQSKSFQHAGKKSK